MDLEAYKVSLLQRFGNVNIKDQIDRICSESSAKVPIFVLPTVTSNLESNRSIDFAAFLIAAWAIYSLGKDDKGGDLIIKDAMATTLHDKAVVASNGNPKVFLEIESVFGQLITSKRFVEAYTTAYQNLEKLGTKKSVLNLNNSNSNTI